MSAIAFTSSFTIDLDITLDEAMYGCKFTDEGSGFIFWICVQRFRQLQSTVTAASVLEQVLAALRMRTIKLLNA